jgi:protein-disulfide isomerase
VRLKVQGTPTVFLNGRRIKGAQPIEVFREAIDRVLVSR